MKYKKYKRRWITEYVRIGNIDIGASRIGLGTWAMDGCGVALTKTRL